MPDEKSMDREAKAYFDTLPAQVQEQIMQSGTAIRTEEELKQLCKNLFKGIAPE